MILQMKLCTFNKLSINFAWRQHILHLKHITENSFCVSQWILQRTSTNTSWAAFIFYWPMTFLLSLSWVSLLQETHLKSGHPWTRIMCICKISWGQKAFEKNKDTVISSDKTILILLCLILMLHFDAWFWRLILTLDFDTWLWCLILTLDFDTWFWHLILTLDFDAWFWRLILTHDFDACWHLKNKSVTNICVKHMWRTLETWFILQGVPKKKFMLGNLHNFWTNGHSDVCEESNWRYFWVLNTSRPLPEV